MALVTCDRAGVVVETVKPAEDGDGVVVRLYEAHNSRGLARLTFVREVSSAEETNMLEERVGDLRFEGQVVDVPVRPYGIVSIRVRFL
jgi:alpha-mannosidase